MKVRYKALLTVLLLFALPAVVRSQFTFTTNNGAITITGYTGSGGAVAIPGLTNGLPVTSIGDEAFLGSDLTSVIIPDSVTTIGYGAFSGCYHLTSATLGSAVTNIGAIAFNECTSLTAITIPDSVTSLGLEAFYFCTSLNRVTVGSGVSSIEGEAFTNCYSLTEAYFKGNAHGADPSLFSGDDTATVYYLPGTTNWTPTFAGRPTVLWNPQVQTRDASFGVRTNRFGFTIAGGSNLVIMVEACVNPANPAWTPVGTNTLIGGSSYFCDPQWSNYPSRFYRLRSP